ncbi:MAG: hypothetical protein WBP85_14445 [Terracidiphilus sp.]
MQEGFRYCPACGLPQLVYSAENSADTEGQPDRWEQAIRDANAVDWRSAARSILPLAVVAGALCALFSPGGLFGLVLMGAAAAWAVALYSRSQPPAQSPVWITARAGARIGLVCGLLAGALAFAVSGGELYAKRYILHQGSQIDTDWKSFVDYETQLSQKVAAWTPDPAQFQAQTVAQANRMLTPEGHSGNVVADFALASFLLVLFAVAGGALGARRIARTRRQGT